MKLGMEMLLEKKKALKRLDMKPRLLIVKTDKRRMEDMLRKEDMERKIKRRLKKRTETWKVCACSFGDNAEDSRRINRADIYNLHITYHLHTKKSRNEKILTIEA